VEDDIPITFALEDKLSAEDVRRRINEYGLLAPSTKWDENEKIQDDAPFMERESNRKAHVNAICSDSPLHANIQKQLCPTEDDMEVTVPTLDLQALRAIARLRHPELSFAEEDISSDLIEFAIKAI
jgi:hypothetical protein